MTAIKCGKLETDRDCHATMVTGISKSVSQQ